MYIDLHTHTCFSDGIYLPETVIRKAEKAGIDLLAIADHNSIEVLKDKKYTCNTHTINAVELTTGIINSHDVPKISLHILGFGINNKPDKIAELINETNTKSTLLLNSFFEELHKEAGIVASNKNVSVKHGRMLQFSDIKTFVEKNLNATNEKVINEILENYKNNWESIFANPESIISAIHSEGGLAIWAHPFITYTNAERYDLSESEIKSVISYLINLGIDGIETYYISFNDTEKNFLHNIAEEESLLESAGSDYHGYKGRTDFNKIDNSLVKNLLKRLNNFS